jgi:hypothetical protein
MQFRQQGVLPAHDLRQRIDAKRAEIQLRASFGAQSCRVLLSTRQFFAWGSRRPWEGAGEAWRVA